MSTWNKIPDGKYCLITLAKNGYMDTRRNFIRKAALSAFILAQPGLLSCRGSHEKENIKDPYFRIRGWIVSWEDNQQLDWAKLAHDAGINTISTDVTPAVKASREWQQFVADCRKYNIQLEHDQHAMGWLLPRNLFEKDPAMFRMNEKGERVADFNCCAHSQPALDIITENALKDAEINPSTSNRYFFWLDDGGAKCFCPLCKPYSDSDQALIIENAMIKALRKRNPAATLAHLAYQRTIKAPETVKPEEGIFLQFAPFQRTWDYPISDPNAQRAGMNIKNGDYLQHLDANLAVFPVESAEILEYWLDVSLYSDWKKPAVKLPWKRDIFLKDIAVYAKRGIRNIVTFAVYIDREYEKNYKDISFLQEYGNDLKNYGA